MNRIRLLTVAIVTVAIGVGIVSPDDALARSATRQSGGARVQTAEEAIAADARSYARSHGVSQGEAVRRLRIQTGMGGLIGQLRRTYRARLAGIVIEHQPVYRVRVRLTGTQPVPPREHALGGSTLPVVFETGAKATLEDLVAAMSVHHDALLRLYPTLSGMGADESSGEIVMYVYAPTGAAADAAKAIFPQAQALLGVPARIEITSDDPTTF